jgi:hypothetical protein
VLRLLPPSRAGGPRRVVCRFTERRNVTLDPAYARIRRPESPATPAGESAEEGWLGQMQQGEDPAAALAGLPDAMTNPLRGLAARFESVLAAYRFPSTARGMMAWAEHQTGLRDPLSAYARDTLERAFEQFRAARDEQLRALAQTAEAEGPSGLLAQIRARAEEEARAVLDARQTQSSAPRRSKRPASRRDGRRRFRAK